MLGGFLSQAQKLLVSATSLPIEIVIYFWKKIYSYLVYQL